jgi:DNA-binding transcriptional ArsR family regulator/uncharacterized protein YndB with AHSA1/START domain
VIGSTAAMPASGARDLLDPVFRALADPSRRALLDRLNEHNGQSLQELCVGLHMARQSVSKHLGILEAANLVTTVRRGRRKLHYLNAVPINEIAERWINRYDRARVRALSDLKRALEEPIMERPAFVYVTYIATTPEQLWRALTEPAFTSRYWGVAFESDWQKGSTYSLRHVDSGVVVVDDGQVVLESDPFRRLSYSWNAFTAEWAAAYGIAEDVRASLAAEPRSKVSFDLEPVDEFVKLTVVHDGFEPGSEVLAKVTNGWPRVLSELKSLLERGNGEGDAG